MSHEHSSRNRYEILEEIGRGSMAIVHRARDPIADRDVAIKTILSPNGVSPERWEQFQKLFHRQAEAAEGLSHQGIVAVYDVDDDPENGRPFIAMELVAGPTLHELIRREGALNADWALTVADTLADALQSAHAAGVVHPDFKPANILVRESDGVAKIADFGVLHFSDSTTAGATHGTPAYLAPECVLGQPPDLRSELFTLAIILYEMLCGAPPFGGTVAELVRESIVDFPHARITERAADLAPAFDAFFERALAKRPADRFQDGASFREALASLRQAQQQFRQAKATDTPAGFETNAAPDVPAAASPAPAPAPASTAAAAAAALPKTVPAAPRPAVEKKEPAARVAPKSAAPSALPKATARSRPAPVPTPAPRRAAVTAGWTVAAIVLLILLAVGMVWVLRSGRSGAVESTGTTGTAHPAPPTAALDRVAPVKAPTPTTAAVRPQEPAAPLADRAAAAAAPKPATVKKPSAVRPVRGTPAAAAAREEDKPAPPAVATVEKPPAPIEPAAKSAPVETAQLALYVKSSLKEGTLTLRVDGRQVYSVDLVSEAKQWKKVIGKAAQDFEARVEIPAGARTLTAHVLNTAKSREHEASLDVDLAAGEQRGLRIVAGRTIGPPLTLTLE